MNIYDISQELFSCCVFPGDPAPAVSKLLRVSEGDVCNLSAFSLCAHNGTHVDAPWHFLDDGVTVEQLELHKLVGMTYVTEHNGIITGQDAAAILASARALGGDCWKRILLKGAAEVSLEAAQVFATAGISLIGNESQTVGPENAPRAVHLCLLSREVVLLEGIRLDAVPAGQYLLSAAPLKLAGFDGAPCRALLIEL